ncbi:MAG: NAD(P)-dependent alcohol dehydrogenase [Methylocella sp.]
MFQCTGFATRNENEPLGPFSFNRRDPGPKDVEIEILYCGVCHSDLHQTRNEWHNTVYPCLPGHEIAGRVTKTGAEVTLFKKGDLAAVGCMVDSCRSCRSCRVGLEQYCEKGFNPTYNGVDKVIGGPTFGGYSNAIVVDEAFVLRISGKLDLAGVAPLVCAGITTYSPLRHWKVGPGQKAGIAGLGGLGHMGIKFSHAFGAHTVLFTTSPSKVLDGKRLGADEVVISKNPGEMAAHANSLDFILDTIAGPHEVSRYLDLLKRDGALVQVGAPEKPMAVEIFSLIFKRRNFAGSLVGGSKAMQEMLDFWAEHQIIADVEIVPIQKINEAYERMLRSDVKYRFSIDLSSLSRTA